MSGSEKSYWVDVHTHLHMLKADLDEVGRKALSAGVEKLITVGTSGKDWDLVLKNVEKGLEGVEVYGALGCHPHSAKEYSDSMELYLKESLKKKGIAALGEIGLDYYYKNSEAQVQRDVFRRQMSAARDLGLNVEIHTREAEEDTIEILSEYKGSVQGLLHCFTGTWDLARRALDLGYNISFSGILTFKKADHLREVCGKVPLDRLHIETDAPYLAPMPYRGKENQPAFMLKTAETVGEIHKVSLEKVKEKTWGSVQKLFCLAS